MSDSLSGGGLPPHFVFYIPFAGEPLPLWLRQFDASWVCTAASTSDSVWPHIVFGW